MGQNKKQLTIKDIAKIAGVSTATISNALSGKRHVKEETKKKILETVDEYSYVPNIIARGLVKKKTGIIGIILPDINNPFYAEVVQGIDEEAKKRDYLTVVVSTYYDDDVEIAQLKKLGSMFIDGYIFVGGSCGFEKVMASISDKEGFVLVNRYCRNGNYSAVVVDSDQAVKEAVSYLFQKGHKSIGYMGWCTGKIIIPENKYQGYLKGLEENRLYKDSSIIFMARKIVSNQYKYGYEAMERYLVDHKKLHFSALICQTDIIALGAMRSLQNSGFNIPGDASILGFGNLNAARLSNPAISSINMPKRRMGKAGATILFDALLKGSNRCQKVCLKTKVVERESVQSVD